MKLLETCNCALLSSLRTRVYPFTTVSSGYKRVKHAAVVHFPFIDRGLRRRWASLIVLYFQGHMGKRNQSPS